MGWHQKGGDDFKCYFLKVMDPHYLVFLYFVTIITPALLLAAFYAHIYRVVLKQLRQIVTMNPENGTSTTGRTHGGTMLRMLGAQQKREVKATQNLSIIVLFFMICWIPLYTINFILAFCKDCFQVNSTFMLFCVILSHLNSAGNPLLYAYHLRDFRAALKCFLFKLFGYVDPSVANVGVNGRPSLGSNIGFQSNYSHRRLQSVRESRSALALSQQTKLSESQMSLSNRLMTKSHSLPNPPKISSIVTQTATLAAAPTGDTAREIWRISEVPSISEDHSRSREISLHKNTRSHSESSGRVNSGYVEEPLELEEGDDDVFLDDYIPSLNVSNDEDVQNSSSETMNTNSDRADVTSALNKLKTNCLSSSSPQLTRGLFLVETELNKEKQEQPKKFIRSGSVVEQNEKKTIKTFSGDFLHSPVKSLKLSPLKAVGDFLLHHRRSKSTTKLNLNEENNGISEQYSRKENSIGVN
ncbi:hypothetical protein ILUMI_07675 [Ignelater luminosus]|uniref:G-protein coupled receptors family 1 profile domain-containing protein n=1 Tax=Ignelater luminosus TaxID=2038154 RepID=A0A8K0D5Z7_IGNLU|nr:hypothetical protein ILUMI_07675 [Ignelater luminosus]